MGCGEAEHHGGRAGSRSAPLMAARKQKGKQEEAGDKIFPSKTLFQ
jgi:hypothetical protein